MANVSVTGLQELIDLTEKLLNYMIRTKNNDEFIDLINQAMK